MDYQEAYALVTEALSEYAKATPGYKYKLKAVYLTLFKFAYENRKINEDTASETNYTPKYLNVVASELWRLLTPVLGYSVNKKNLSTVVEQYKIKKDQARNSDRENEEELKSIWLPVRRSNTKCYVAPIINPYFRDERMNDYGVTLLEGAKLSGKTTYLDENLQSLKRKGHSVVKINLALGGYTDTKSFLKNFCYCIAGQLGLTNSNWDNVYHPQGCKDYFNREILPSLPSYLFIGLDNLHFLYKNASISNAIIPMLQDFLEESTLLNNQWKKLRLTATYSAAEVYINSNKVESLIFNGIPPMQLQPWTVEQIRSLALRAYEIDLRESEITSMSAVVGRNPYRIQMVLNHLHKEQATLEQVLKKAPTQEGFFEPYLSDHFNILEQNSALKKAIREVLKSPEGAVLLPIPASILRNMGLVYQQGNKSVMSCTLFTDYFSPLLLR